MPPNGFVTPCRSIAESEARFLFDMARALKESDPILLSSGSVDDVGEVVLYLCRAGRYERLALSISLSTIPPIPFLDILVA